MLHFQVPQSYTVKQTIEPSYSSRLQTANSYYSNLSPINSHSHSLSNTSTLPLDSALHRPTPTNTYSNVSSENNLQYSNVWPTPKLTSNSSGVQNLVPKAYSKPTDQHVTYSNVQSRNQDGLIYSNLVHPHREGAVYSNMPSSGAGTYNGGKFKVTVSVFPKIFLLPLFLEDLPPPPPPLELTSSHISEYQPCTVNTNFPPPPPDELPPPPSPVSSSYSELRRATQPNQDFSNYGLGSQVREVMFFFGGYILTFTRFTITTLMPVYLFFFCFLLY